MARRLRTRTWTSSPPGPDHPPGGGGPREYPRGGGGGGRTGTGGASEERAAARRAAFGYAGVSKLRLTQITCDLPKHNKSSQGLRRWPLSSLTHTLYYG